jgi:Zn-dependent M16 (insulinase) family peptidase
MSNAHSSFEIISQKHIDSLNIDLTEYRHKKTGAMHVHMQADSDENVFLVALRTVPEDSTGVAHILEHTALCGSEQYPVRDPFFMMTRRSLNTFMNAFTSSDWTAYPFASMNKKDYHNLLDVYLDAVFFARLDPLDFAQEGHRLEFSEMSNPESELEFKGVVFNEMKGAMSSVNSQLWQTVTKYLFPDSTYHFNSGGEPEHIPDLSYDELKHFYKTHYHPSNAIFMTFGDIPASTLQEKFETQALHKFDKLDEEIAVTEEKRYFAPVNVEEYYANNDEDIENKTHVVLAWLLGESTDLDAMLNAQILSSVLLDNSAAPLMHALESSELGSAPSPMCGLDDSQKEMSFMCGLAGTASDAANDVETLILDLLRKVVKEGIPKENIEAALHQLELSKREIGGDSYPFGLQLILRSLNSANHRGDPSALLDLDDAMARLRNNIQDPEFIPNLIRTLILDNPHRVRLSLKPDQALAARKEAAEKLRLKKIQSALSVDEKQHIIEQSLALKARQDQADDPGCLPKVGLEDVPKTEISVDGTEHSIADTKLCFYPTGTNGLTYQQVIFDLPKLSDDHHALLSIYGQCVTELGSQKRNYLDMQKRQAAATGGISAFSSLRGGVEDVNSLSGYYCYSGKSLNRNHDALCDILQEVIECARFDETSRIQEIVSQIRTHLEQGITGSGHIHAMNAASSSLSVPAYLSHQHSGLVAVQRIIQLDKDIKSEAGIEQLSQSLQNIHHSLTSQPKQLLLIAEANTEARLLGSCERFSGANSAQDKLESIHFAHDTQGQAWVCNTQVNFCAQAYPTVPSGHEDAAALVVLGNYLRNGFLHRTIREQGGAYGGGASQDSNAAVFRFYSYRDPRLEETIDDFNGALDWLKNTPVPDDKLEEAILGTISSIDRSESPAGRAKRCFYAELHGRNLEQRKLFRSRVLNTSADDLQRVADTYLQADKACTAVVTNKSNAEKTEAMGLKRFEL